MYTVVRKYYKQCDELNKAETFDGRDDDVAFIIDKIKKCRIKKKLKDRLSFVIFNALFDEKIGKYIKRNRYLLRGLYDRCAIDPDD